MVMANVLEQTLEVIRMGITQQLSQDGIFVVIATVDTKTGMVRKSPDIISRGFIYLKESKDLLKTARGVAKKTIEDIARKSHPVNFDFI